MSFCHIFSSPRDAISEIFMLEIFPQKFVTVIVSQKFGPSCCVPAALSQMFFLRRSVKGTGNMGESKRMKILLCATRRIVAFNFFQAKISGP